MRSVYFLPVIGLRCHVSNSLSARFGGRLPAALMITTLLTLCIELLLSRLISVLFMSGDAYWVVAVALLGFGAGGAFVACGGKRLAENAEHLLSWLIWGIGLSAIIPLLCFRYARPELTYGSAAQIISPIFLAVSLACFFPFFFASIFLALVFMRCRNDIGRLYCFDLLGSGLGCLVFLILLRSLGLENAILAVAVASILTSLLLTIRFSILVVATNSISILLCIAAGFLLQGPSPMLPFAPRELRMLYEYQTDKAQLDFQRWDPIARIDITSVKDAFLKLPDTARYKLLTQDGGAPSILLGFDKPFQELEFPERSLLGIAYWNKQSPKVLIIGPGGGPDVAAALRYNPSKVTVVELNSTTIEVVEEVFADFTGNLYQQPNVDVYNDDGRHFVRTTRDSYDVIQLTGVDTTVLGSAGAIQNLTENYLYTLQAFGDYYDHLTPDGYFSLSYPDFFHWGLRATAMLLKLMHDRGIPSPERHLVVSMNGGYVNILMKKSPFTLEEVSVIHRHFKKPLKGLLLPLYYHLWGQYLPRDSLQIYVDQNFFDQQAVLYDPFTTTDSLYTQLVNAWLSAPDSAAFWNAGGGFKPAVDDQPFFFTPIGVGKLFSNRIVWLCVAAFAVILLPLALFKKRGLTIEGAGPLAAYFACLGLAFIAIEMILLQKFVLFLGHPTYSFAVVLGVLLVSTGIGSYLSERIGSAPIHGIYTGIGGIAAYSILFVLGIDGLTRILLTAPLGIRMIITGILVVPLGISMGMMFPSGIRLLNLRSRDFIPWAWGINGSTSVIGSVMSLFLAIKIGFSALLLYTIVIYLFAGLMAVRISRR